MRKTYRAYTEETFHGEAPALDTAEGKAILAQNPDLIESKVLNEEIPEILSSIKKTS